VDDSHSARPRLNALSTASSVPPAPPEDALFLPPVLSANLHGDPVEEVLFIRLFEEEVPRGGARVLRRFEHTRWVDGSTFLWLARRKQAGAGEGSSGLRFDLVEETVIRR
jgi:hypothetical protein